MALPELGGRPLVPAHPDAQAWLRRHFAEGGAGAPLAAPSSLPPCPAPDVGGGAAARRFLVLATVGDSWAAEQ